VIEVDGSRDVQATIDTVTAHFGALLPRPLAAAGVRP